MPNGEHTKSKVECRYCGEPIRYAGGRWWHINGWFTNCKGKMTKAFPK